MTKPNRPPFCLQENNAIAVFDLLSASFTAIWPLGWKSWSANLVDVSDMDGVDLRTFASVKAWCVHFPAYWRAMWRTLARVKA